MTTVAGYAGVPVPSITRAPRIRIGAGWASRAAVKRKMVERWVTFL
jgi:hypothetical protein